MKTPHSSLLPPHSSLLLLGDEALALGAIDAGLSGVYAYPGTPSTEITEFIQVHAGHIRSRWCTNEKTAMEAALGMSFAGKRALVCMKHVGMNVCADAFLNSAITGVNGGLVVVAADDPSMHSSQNEQDSRFYAKFAMIMALEPSNQQEAYDMARKAFDLSEELRLPVMLRMVTRLAHSRAAVERREPRAENGLNPVEGNDWVLLPAIAKRRYNELIGKQERLRELSDRSEWLRVERSGRGKLGVIAMGIGYNYVCEAQPDDVAVLKVSQYPLPQEHIRALAEETDELLIVEDGQPVVEEAVRGLVGRGHIIRGRLTGDLPRTGELTPDSVAHAFGREAKRAFPAPKNLAPRPPQLCKGCSHRDVYEALGRIAGKLDDLRVFGDIGCYTLGALPPYRRLNSCVDMGASITMAKGAADAGVAHAVAVIGDSTFTHSGMTGLLDAVNDGANLTVLISDNLTTAMTGGQDSAGLYKYEQICLALGVEREHLRVVVPRPHAIEEVEQILREEIEYKGVSVVIARRECMQTLRRHKKK